MQRATCYVCGRELSDPVSVERGIGPECLAWVKANRQRLLNPDGQGCFAWLWRFRRARLERAGVDLTILEEA
jgi:hypothetical protein